MNCIWEKFVFVLFLSAKLKPTRSNNKNCVLCGLLSVNIYALVAPRKLVELPADTRPEAGNILNIAAHIKTHTGNLNVLVPPHVYSRQGVEALIPWRKKQEGLRV